uniref:AH domain-containing protein n=1 Tax=Hymenolepis diminuta TaxID=6216 RepID=A0A0R3SC95_HYMDI
LFRRIQAKYQEMSTTVKKMITHMNAITVLEQSLSSQLTVAAQHQPELTNEFAQNAELQRVVAVSTNSYIGGLELFCDGLDTFCKKTIPDTLTTIRQLEHARLVYDAHRNDLARLEAKASGKVISTTNSTTQPASTETPAEDSVANPASTSSAATATPQLELNVQQMRQKFAAQKEIYLALKKDTDVKMKLLHENRTRVMRKHLNSVQAATLSYYANGFSALNEALKALMEQQHITPSDLQNRQEISFLEIESPSPYTKAPQTPNQYSSAQQQKSTHFALTENGLEDSGNDDCERDVFQD